MSTHTKTAGALAMVAALLGGSTARAQDPKPSPAAEAPTTDPLAPDHRFEAGARIGTLVGGEITPHNVPRGFTSTSWLIAIDGNFLANRYFMVGPFASFSNASYHQEISGKTTGTGDLTLVTLGVSGKARIPITEALTAQVGAELGRNIISATIGGTDASGGGIDFGASASMTYRFSEYVGATAQLGFLTQVAGSVSAKGGDDVDLAFTPKVYLNVGPTFMF